MAPLNNLSLEVAAQVDIEDGELEPVEESEESLYAQPSLKDGPDERDPFPYRREAMPDASAEEGPATTREVILDEATLEMTHDGTKKNADYFL